MADVEETAVLRCPDCNRVFERPQALGAHRARAHGYRKSARKNARKVQTKVNGRGAVDHLDNDRLLKTVFPYGLPAKADVMERAGAWLREGELLFSERRR